MLSIGHRGRSTARILLGAVLFTMILAPTLGRASTSVAAGLAITGLTASASSVPLYQKFELTFNVSNTVATNLQFPYDPAPPPGLPAGIGITVQGLFLPPGQSDWSRALVQPGFLYQDYQRQQINGVEWLYPRGGPVWKIRFAPSLQGTWQYRVQAQDASICPPGVNPCPNWVQTAIGSFTVGPPAAGDHGFLHVSTADPRYFEFSDGTPFIGLGHDEGFNVTNLTYDAEAKLAGDSANGIDFLRVWMSGSDIAGSAWGPWVWFGGPQYGGYLPDPGLAIAPSGSGHDYVFSLDSSANRFCLFNGWTQGHIAVKPSTTYRLSVTVQVAGVNGPRDPSRSGYGFTVKQGDWVNACPDDLASVPNLVPYVQNSGWITVQGTITTSASEYFLPYLYLMLDNVTAGQANVSQVSLREVLPDGSLGPEILAKSASDMHMDFNQPRSWDWDYILDRAAQNHVYLKLVVLEKNDRVWNDINPDGTLTASGSNNNFYAAPNTKVRRLHEYFWRYLAARWSYTTGLHSWELLNEGDPYNGYHYEMANSFARLIHQLDPNRHMVTTSTWAGFPVKEFWANPSYPDLDYADLHAYISTGLGSYEWSPPAGTTLETNPSNTYRGSAGAIAVPAGVVSGSKAIPIRGQGTWTISAVVRAQGIAGSCPYGAPANLAGPQLLVGLDSSNTMVIPTDPRNPSAYWICTSPAGTYDYQPISGTLTVPDSGWHQLVLTFQNRYATSGTAWFDNLVIQAPDGRVARLYGDGSFDDRIRMDYDSSWFTTVYSLLDGATSLSGAGKPLVRGETGLDYPGGPQQELPDLARDVHGVWLHNLEWATLNPGGMYDLYWWTDNIVKNNLAFQYRAVHDFLTGIPINNGRFRDAGARASSGNVRALGQKDPQDGLAYVWIQNVNHTWYNVVNGIPWGTLSGTVTIAGFSPGQTYAVEWWEFDDPGNLTRQQGSITADGSGNLVLDLSSLPATTTDVAVKISGPGSLPYTVQLSPILK
ncbi:MAG: hypothetical protein IRY83_08945 [Chloroflexi bacterium]|nr:hypothetical protein [Chloroflexota bacterium]